MMFRTPRITQRRMHRASHSSCQTCLHRSPTGIMLQIPLHTHTYTLETNTIQEAAISFPSRTDARLRSPSTCRLRFLRCYILETLQNASTNLLCQNARLQTKIRHTDRCAHPRRAPRSTPTYSTHLNACEETQTSIEIANEALQDEIHMIPNATF